jgi:ribose 5-phosphate isomerase A
VTPDEQKRAAAQAAVRLIDASVHVIGLGSGSTSLHFVRALPVHLAAATLDGRVCVATSSGTAAVAQQVGLDLVALDEVGTIDLTVDGADEIAPGLACIKGAGGALLREKIVAAASKRMVVIADETKLVARLGKFALPVEVLEFGHKTSAAHLARIFTEQGYNSAAITLRQREGAVFRSDSGNLIYDCALGAITSAARLAPAISSIPGVVGHGLFVGIATTLVVAHPGEVEVIEREPAAE